MISFVETVLLGCLSQTSLTAFIPPLFGMLVNKDFSSHVTSKLPSGTSSIWFRFWIKSFASLIYDSIYLTIGCK